MDKFYTVSAFIFVVLTLCAGFRIPGINHDSRSCRTMHSLQMADRAAPLLNKDTLWRLRLNLVGEDGVSVLKATARLRFVEERGYEPPSGKIFIEEDYTGLIRTNEKGYAASWTLSEDKDDRKDGLWIMGLFKEPKYPYLYFALGVFDSYLLPSGEEQPFSMVEGDTTGGVPGDKLSFQFNHLNKGEEGRVLSGGIVRYKRSEMLNLPLTKVDIGEDVSAGTVELSPIYDNDREEEEQQAPAESVSAEASSEAAATPKE